MITGTNTTVKNLRSTPNDVSDSNLIGKLLANSSFTGSGETSQDSRGRGLWIKLSTINDTPVTVNTWLAGWVVDYKIIPDPIPEEPIGVPVELRLTEVFSNGTTRESVWVNPTVVE